jgi:hypothetical protein
LEPLYGADSERSRVPRPTTPVRPRRPPHPAALASPRCPSRPPASTRPGAQTRLACGRIWAAAPAGFGGGGGFGRWQQDLGVVQRGSPAPALLPSVMSPSGEALRIQAAAEGARQQRALTYRLCHYVGGRNVFFSFDMRVLHVIGMKGILELYQTFFRI